MSELVERLRRLGNRPADETSRGRIGAYIGNCAEAAARIEAQEAEINRLTAENTTMRATLNLIARRKGAWQQPARAPLSPVLIEDGK